MKKHNKKIESFEINGHTSSEWANINFTNEFLNNEKLSMNRSYSTISYIFKNQDAKTQKWLSKIIKGSGFSSSKNVMFNDKEDRLRRVYLRRFIHKKELHHLTHIYDRNHINY